MALIKKIAPASRNSDLSSLLTLILKVLAKTDWSADTYLTSILENLIPANTSLTEALKRLVDYSEMASKDSERDLEITSLFKLIEGYSYMPFDEVKETNLIIKNVLEQYGLGIKYEDFAAESADVQSMLKDLASADVVAAADKLQGVTKTISAIRTKQEEFENMALEQAEGESVKKDLSSASQLKKECITEINSNLVGYLNTMAKVQPDTYKATAKTIGELIDGNNELVKRRKTNNSDSKEL
ncbi:DUF6261 family protein [Labilibaculum sp.]|uniref:DUF6261 family protein n=1 Tax=Labilibaculum sp. TaxID=2060723 RepID=UPI003563CC72